MLTAQVQPRLVRHDVNCMPELCKVVAGNIDFNIRKRVYVSNAIIKLYLAEPNVEIIPGCVVGMIKNSTNVEEDNIGVRVVVGPCMTK